jgi:hypothetical protein
MIISRIFNNNKYQISYGFTGKFIGKGRYNTLWFLSPLQRLKYVINWANGIMCNYHDYYKNNSPKNRYWKVQTTTLGFFIHTYENNKVNKWSVISTASPWNILVFTKTTLKWPIECCDDGAAMAHNHFLFPNHCFVGIFICLFQVKICLKFYIRNHHFLYFITKKIYLKRYILANIIIVLLFDFSDIFVFLVYKHRSEIGKRMHIIRGYLLWR